MKKYIMLVLISFLMVNSCTLVTEPERFYNDEAYPPDLYYFNFENLQPGQHVDGTTRIYFNPPNIDYDFNEILIMIDSIIYRSFNTLPYVIELNTRQFDEGLHTVSLYIYQKDKPHGLLNILNPPSDIFQTSLYFDRTPLSPVQLTVSNNNNESISLNWTENTDQTFFAYIVYKSINDDNFFIIDTIYNRSCTTIIDTTNLTIIGANYSYKVVVATDYLFTYKSESNIGKCKLGNAFEYPFSVFKGGPYLDDERDVVYYIVDNQLVSFSTINFSLINKVNLIGLPSSGDNIFLNFNNDKTKIFILNQLNKAFWIINSIDFNLESHIILPEASRDFYILDNSRILINHIDSLTIINFNTNEVLNKLILPIDTHAQFGVVNEEGTKLILSWWPQFVGHFFVEMDITNNDFQILRQVQSDYTHRPLVITENKLFNNGTKIYDLSSFNYYNLTIPDQFSFFSAYKNHIVTLIYDYWQTDHIYVYNLQSQLIKSWEILSGFQIQIGDNKVITEFGKDNILGYSLKFGE
jgi:hypothetical protein